MDSEPWYGEVHVVTKSRTWLSDWTELMHFNSQFPAYIWFYSGFSLLKHIYIIFICKLAEKS